jgi:hypothetical protein
LSRRGGGAEYGDPLGFASLATLGFILELLVVKEKLFPGSENEITPTIDTLQHLVLKIHLRMAPFNPFRRAHPRGRNCGGFTENTGLCTAPPLYCPLDSARHALRRGVGYKLSCFLCRKNDEYKDPVLLKRWGPDLSRAAPGRSGSLVR